MTVTSQDYTYFLNGHSANDELVKQALVDVKKSGLSAEILEQAQVRIFNGSQEKLREQLGFSLNSQKSIYVQFPYFDESGKTTHSCFKLIPPLVEKDGKELRYLSPAGKPAIPYIPVEVWKVKDKRNRPICITEGVKKALALIGHGRSAITLSGVWNFKASKNSEDEASKYLWEDLQKFRWKGRTVYLAFDADLWINPNVRAALYELAFKLKAKGAIIEFARWPVSQGKGIDDYLANCQDPVKALSELEQSALAISDEGALPFDHKPEIVRAFVMAKPEMSEGTKEWFILVLSQVWGIAKETIELEISDIEKKISPSIEWEDPIPFNDCSLLPDFPINALPAIGRDTVKAISEVVQIDTGIAANTYIPSLAVCLQKKAVVDLGTHQEPLNTYHVSVAESGERKSAMVKILTEPLYLYQENSKEKLLPEINEKLTDLRIKEQRLLEFQKRAAKTDDETERKDFEQKARDLAKEIFENPVPKEPRFLADDCTEEKLGLLMVANNEKMGIFSTEGHLFCLMAGLYSDKTVNLNLFLKSHPGDPWSTDRISRESLSMKSPCLTLCLAAQPDVIADIGQIKQFRGRGLLARFLFSWSKTQVGYRERQAEIIREDLLTRYRQHILELMNIPLPSEPYILTLSKDAQALWDEFYNDVEREMRPGGSLEHLKDWGSKLPGAVARIAGNLHFAEYGANAINKPIPFSIVSSACVIGAYYKEHALATFGFMQLDPRIEAAKNILDYITSHKVKSFKGRDVLANKNVFKSMADILPGLDTLIERNYIREQQPGKKTISGRPEAVLYLVNPEINILKNHQQYQQNPKGASIDKA